MYTVSLTLLSILVLVSCGGDISKDAVQGRWELMNATKNGKPTRILDGAHFEFIGDSLQSNLVNQEIWTSYEISSTTLQPQIGEAFEIDTFSTDLLVLTVNKKRNAFTLNLKRSND